MGLVASAILRARSRDLRHRRRHHLPATQFLRHADPDISLQGLGAFIGRIYPTSHYLTIARGTFSKALGFADLTQSFIPLAIAVPLLIALAAALLAKQER